MAYSVVEDAGRHLLVLALDHGSAAAIDALGIFDRKSCFDDEIFRDVDVLEAGVETPNGVAVALLAVFVEFVERADARGADEGALFIGEVLNLSCGHGLGDRH